MSDAIYLSSFVNDEIKKLENFRYYWQVSMGRFPDKFPVLLPAGEWRQRLRDYDRSSVAAAIIDPGK